MKREIATLVILVLLISGNQIIAQNNQPIAVNDSLMPIFELNFTKTDTTLYINVIENDFDPNGDPIKIFDVKNRRGQGSTTITFNDSTIILTIQFSLLQEQVYDYRICKISDTTFISNWAYLNVNPALDETYPVARIDTVFGIPGHPVSVNVLKNDYHPLQDSMFVYYSNDLILDSIVTITCPEYSNNDFFSPYYLTDTSVWYLRYDLGLVYIKLLNNEWYDSLNINNINARFNCFGMHFWDMNSNPHFKVPNGSETSSIFTQSLWMGGLDENLDLHVAGELYKQTGRDYWHGPISDIYDSLYDQRWLHVWKLSRDEIENHKTHWSDAGYEPLSDILTWPGNGDINLGQSEFIAPFDDNNQNGIYEPLLGDAPQIRGDQALFFVYNDARELHTESQGIPLGIEIRSMAYAFDQAEDSALWNTIFLHYDIVNRSDTAYHDMYLGIFTDTELGGGYDDRIECDVQSGMYFTYNGDEYDENTEWGENGYGEHPPAQGIMILGGPTLEIDGIDNPKFDILGQQIVDESINGLNFGDGIIDNERMGMTRFIHFGYNQYYPLGYSPENAEEYYMYLQSIWLNGTHLQYGGKGHQNEALGPECNFLWPRDSDPFNWGTNGIIPNGGYNQNGLYWSEEQVNTAPFERKGLGSTGPFIFLPGQTQSLDLALPWARDYNGTAWSSAELLKERAKYIKNKFENDENFFSGYQSIKSNIHNISVYPNPVSNILNLELPAEVLSGKMNIYNVQGTLVNSSVFQNTKVIKINTTGLTQGLYFIRIESFDSIYTAKFIKK